MSQLIESVPDEIRPVHRPPLQAIQEQRLVFDTLFGGQAGYLVLFSSTPGRIKPSGSVELLDQHSAYFTYPDQAEAAMAYAAHATGQGRELHLCPHLLRARRRVKENALPLGALWADADGAKLPEGFPAPTLAVRSSPGMRHLYWSLRRPLEPEAGERLNRRLTRTIGADTGGWPLASLLRLPGSANHKHPGAPPLEIVSHDPDLDYHPRELEIYLQPEEPVQPMNLVDLGRRMPRRPGEPPADLSVLSPRMLDLIHNGNDGAGKPYKSRSEADFAVALAMFGAGYDPDAVHDVLSDPSNRISAKFAEKGRHGERYLATTISRAARNATPADPTLAS